MKYRNRPGGTILDRQGYDPALDPGSLLVPMREPKAERQCHCSARTKRNDLNGMKPMLDLEEGVIRCGLCFAEIDPSCRTREVMWLRGLLSLSQRQPEHF